MTAMRGASAATSTDFIISGSVMNLVGVGGWVGDVVWGGCHIMILGGTQFSA